MKRYFLTVFFTLFVPLVLSAQQPVRRLPGIINHPSLNLFSPFMSSDGNAIVFISDNGREGEYITSYTSRELDWTPPVELPKHINNRLNFTRGYSLSADGKKLYFTSAKSPVIGGYDIFVTELKGTVWTNPENLMLPVNSKTNDGCPSYTPDGNTLYFMRCERMNTVKAEACKIFRAAKKPNGQWGEPEELPAHINTGNSQTPRIMADMETLIFSSDQTPGNKGGMDLYLTRYIDGKWQEPIALDFVNSERDDQYISVNALGRYLLTEARGTRNNWELTELLIPVHLRPKGMMKIEGTVSGSTGAEPAYISVTDIRSGKRIFSGRPAANGTYFLYLREGSVYELAIDPERSEKTFLTKTYDLTGDKIAQREKLDVSLERPENGDELLLDQVVFAPHSHSLLPASYDNLKRMARLIKANKELRFEIQVLLQGYRESEDNSDPDLTEEYLMEETIDVYDSAGYDSLSAVELPADSVFEESAIDTLRQVVEQRVVQRVIYHNDRTQKQAEAIRHYLISNGVSPDQLTTLVNAVPSDSSESQTKILVRVFGAKPD